MDEHRHRANRVASAASWVRMSYADDIGFLSGDFRRDYRYALAAVERPSGPSLSVASRS